MLRTLFIAAMLAAATLCTGCASIVNGHNQSVSVKTTGDGGDVSGAQCELKNDKGSWFTTTPGSVTVRRSYNDLLVSCKVGNSDAGTLAVKSTTKGMAFGNVIFGGVIGAGIDVASGAAYDYPNLITVPLSGGVAGAARNTAVVAAVAGPSAAAFPAGTLLVVQDIEPISGAPRGEAEFIVAEQTASQWTFNQGRIVVRADGSPVKGVMHDGMIYGVAPQELARGGSWPAHFRGIGRAGATPITLTSLGRQTKTVSGRQFDAVQLRIDGNAPHGSSYGGAVIGGEMWVDVNSGLVLSVAATSRHPAFALRRELVKISAPA